MQEGFWFYAKKHWGKVGNATLISGACGEVWLLANQNLFFDLHFYLFVYT